MNYQIYFYISCVLGLVLAAILTYQSITLFVLRYKKVLQDEALSDSLKQIAKQSQLLGTRGYQIVRRDEKIGKLEKQVAQLKEELFAFHEVTKKKTK